MNTFKNQWGELQTNWQSHKHPNNPNFMQVVKYMHIQFEDGRNNLYWSLQGSSAYDKHVIANITLDKALELYTDLPDVELTDEMFEKWKKENNY